MPAPDRDSKAAPDRHPQPISTAALVLWLQAVGASMDRALLATSPRILSSPDPASERGFTPGTLILGTAPSLYQVGSDGVPVTVVADFTTHVNGGASKHDATEIDFELADGSKKVVQAASDTVETALTDLDAYLGTNLDRLVKGVIAVPNVGGGGTDAALTLQLYRLDGATVIASAKQVLIIASAAQYQPNPPLTGTVTFATATVGSIISSGSGWALVETSAAGAFACTAADSADETIYFRVVSAEVCSDIAKACAMIGTVSDAATWSA